MYYHLFTFHVRCLNAVLQGYQGQKGEHGDAGVPGVEGRNGQQGPIGPPVCLNAAVSQLHRTFFILT